MLVGVSGVTHSVRFFIAIKLFVVRAVSESIETVGVEQQRREGEMFEDKMTHVYIYQRRMDR